MPKDGDRRPRINQRYRHSRNTAFHPPCNVLGVPYHCICRGRRGPTPQTVHFGTNSPLQCEKPPVCTVVFSPICTAPFSSGLLRTHLDSVHRKRLRNRAYRNFFHASWRIASDMHDHGIQTPGWRHSSSASAMFHHVFQARSPRAAPRRLTTFSRQSYQAFHINRFSSHQRAAHEASVSFGCNPSPSF